MRTSISMWLAALGAVCVGAVAVLSLVQNTGNKSLVLPWILLIVAVLAAAAAITMAIRSQQTERR